MYVQRIAVEVWYTATPLPPLHIVRHILLEGLKERQHTIILSCPSYLSSEKIESFLAFREIFKGAS